MLYYSQKAEGEYLSEIAELKAKLQDTEAVRDAFRNAFRNDWFALRQEAEDLRAEVEELKAERIEARERESVSLDAGSNAIIGLTAERDQLRAEVERLKAEAARPAYAFAAPDSVKLWAIYNEESRVKRVYDCAKCALASQLSGEGFAAILPEERSSWEESELPIRLCQCWRAALQGRAPDIPPADPERYAAAGSIPAGSAGEDTPSVWEQSPARPGVQHYTETLSQLPDVQSRLAWLLRGLPKQTKTMEIGVPPALIQEAYDALERLKAELKCWTQGRADLQPVDSDYNNALIGIRWALQDLGLRVKSDPEATKSAVEVLCVQLRKEGRAWTGEMLGGLTCPSQMQKEDNAALKQRVFTALGTELLYRLERHAETDPGLVAQFDLLGRDL